MGVAPGFIRIILPEKSIPGWGEKNWKKLLDKLTKIAYNNLYKIQHKFNELYGLKGSKHSYLNDNKSFKE